MTDISSELAARVQALEDVAEIKDVQYAYWRSIDLKQPDDFRDILAAGEIRINFPGAPLITDREDLIGMVKEHGMAPTYQGSHLGLSPQIRLTSGNSATGSWRVLALAYDFAQRTVTRLIVSYESDYVRTQDGWRIKGMAVRQQSMMVETVAEGGDVTASSFGPVGG